MLDLHKVKQFTNLFFLHSLSLSYVWQILWKSTQLTCLIIIFPLRMIGHACAGPIFSYCDPWCYTGGIGLSSNLVMSASMYIVNRLWTRCLSQLKNVFMIVNFSAALYQHGWFSCLLYTYNYYCNAIMGTCEVVKMFWQGQALVLHVPTASQLCLLWSFSPTLSWTSQTSHTMTDCIWCLLVQSLPEQYQAQEWWVY